MGRDAGLGERELRELPKYRDSDVFSELDRAVIEYAELMTRTPADVPDHLFGALRRHLDDAQLVELTASIAFENYRARFNHALLIEPQGFSEGAFCPIPERP